MGNQNPATQYCHFTGQYGRHADDSNFLMADTHAKWLRGAQVSSGDSAATSTAAQQTFTGGAAAGTDSPTFNKLYASPFS